MTSKWAAVTSQGWGAEGDREATEPSIKRRQESAAPVVRLTRRHASHKFAQCDNDAHAELTEWFFFRGGAEAKMRRKGSQ
jgi:hypothetical protein